MTATYATAVTANSLIDWQDSNGDTALYRAVERSDESSVKQLLLKGANANLGNKNGWQPIHVAVANTDINMVRCLLEAGSVKLNAKTHFGFVSFAL